MEQFIIQVQAEQAKTRLDKLAAEHLADVSRSRIQQLIEEGYVTVNEETSKANYRVRENDVIVCELPEVQELDAKPEDIELDVVYEDHDIIVISKPRGMVVHPAVGNETGTLVNALLYHCADLSGINGVLRPGIVHRIDKDTSGLLVVAKNDQAHVSLSEQLKEKTVSRKYYALVHGVMEHDYGTIDAPIGRDEKDRQKMTVTKNNARSAVTHFKVLERYVDSTLIECVLETGRTHQIRVHMQYIGYPIVGDPKYSFRSTPDCQGQLLHAFELSLIHPTTKQEMTFYREMPGYMKDYIALWKEGMKR